ncbi:Elongator complex protein 5 [Jimgerdemannia flammicorona]|uniref:Elongator complex protein 5 n=1 Tax=Jimgerdemannia flammicorona TaxID=994334 RepID=A0A433CWV0_9FUNG|nr:Elongator complex protein 5 [Jimgerdemannia flammicorona]
MPNTALHRLLAARDSSPCTLICDRLGTSALPLLREFAACALADDQALVLLCTEVDPESFVTELKPLTKYQRSLRCSVTIVDAYTNPFGWEESTGGDKRHYHITNINDIRHVASVVGELVKKVSSQRCTIILDSLSPFLLISSHQTFQLFKKLIDLTSGSSPSPALTIFPHQRASPNDTHPTDTTRLIVLHHTDILPPITTPLAATIPNILASLSHLSSATITVQPPRTTDHDREAQLLRVGFVAEEQFAYLTSEDHRVDRGVVVEVEWKRKSGKVLYETNAYRPDKSGSRLEVVPVSTLLGLEEQIERVIVEEPTVSKSSSRRNITQQPDPTANLSFNLSLTEEQRRARGNVVLPYMKAQRMQVSNLSFLFTFRGYHHGTILHLWLFAFWSFPSDALNPATTTASGGGGSIYYEPDAADDFDDEDPDDDLTI